MERIGDLCVLGLASSGQAVARYALSRLGDEFDSVTVFDSADTPGLREAAEVLRQEGIAVELGRSEGVGRFDLCVASPGIPPHAPLFEWARSASARMISEIEFAFERSESPWIAITGTNGKTTTTSMIAHVLDMGGMPARKVGNIGRPAIDDVTGASPGLTMVAEVSSFQLALTERFRPRVAVLLNISPDHIDWHGSMEAYTSDKVKIFANMGSSDIAVVDIDDPGSAPWADRVTQRGVHVIRVSRTHLPEGGAGIAEGQLALDTSAGVFHVCEPGELAVRGEHNVSNALAAVAAAHAFGVPVSDLKRAITTFQPIEHRLEPAGVVEDVEYFNDSKATNPDAVVKALTAFAERPLIVLLGGRNKGSDFGELAAAVASSARAAVLFGESRVELSGAFERVSAEWGFQVEEAVSMADAVELASQIAHPGDAVLLSPACASFDEFKDYTERGREFKELVARLGRGPA